MYFGIIDDTARPTTTRHRIFATAWIALVVLVTQVYVHGFVQQVLVGIAAATAGALVVLVIEQMLHKRRDPP